MSSQEAIQILCNLAFCYGGVDADDVIEAVAMAVCALSEVGGDEDKDIHRRSSLTGEYKREIL